METSILSTFVHRNDGSVTTSLLVAVSKWRGIVKWNPLSVKLCARTPVSG